MSIRRIVFTGDIFRTSEAREPGQLRNVFWLFRTMAWQVARVSDRLPEIRFRGTDFRDGRELIDSIYRAFGSTPSLDSWARVFWRQEVPETVLSMIANDYRDALVIAIEMPPVMQAALDLLGAPWIDVSISPLRFLEDLLVTFRFSHHFPPRALNRFAISQDDTARCVDGVRSYFRKRPNPKLTELRGAAIFFAQTERDRTLISRSGFVRSEDIATAIIERCNSRRLLLRPHPLAPTNPVLDMCRSRLRAQVTDINTYEILASDIDIAVLTISSSVSEEARAFGKETHVFSPDVLNFAYNGLTTYNAYRLSEFWAAALDGICEINRDEFFSEHFRKNRLRGELGYYSLPTDLY